MMPILQIRFFNHKDSALIKKRGLWWVVALLLVMTVFQFFAGVLGEHLALQRTAIKHGELWRLLSAYMVHANWQHLGINAASLVAGLCLFPEMLSKHRFCMTLLVNGVLLSILLLMVMPENASYYGFSALLYAFLSTSAIYLIQQNPFCLWVILFLLIKMTWEQLYGPLQSSEIMVQGKVATWGHLLGAVIGGVVGALGRLSTAKA